MTNWPRQHTNFARAAYMYYGWTKDETVKGLVDKLGKALVTERWDAKRREFFGARGKSKDGKWAYLGSHSLQTASCVAYCYLVTGKREYAEVARLSYLRSAEQVKELRAKGRLKWNINAGNHLEGFQGLLFALDQTSEKQ